MIYLRVLLKCIYSEAPGNKGEVLLQRALTLTLTGHCFPVSFIPSSKASSMLHFIIDYRVSSFITSPGKCPLVHFPPFANVRSRVGRAGQTSFSQLVCKGLSISAKKQVPGKEAKSLHIPFVFCKGHCPGCRQMSGRLHLRIFTHAYPQMASLSSTA